MFESLIQQDRDSGYEAFPDVKIVVLTVIAMADALNILGLPAYHSMVSAQLETRSSRRYAGSHGAAAILRPEPRRHRHVA